MIDERIVESLREYLKDHYIPLVLKSLTLKSYTIPVCGIICPSSEEIKYLHEKATFKSEYRSLRNISDEASDYIKKNRKPGGFAYELEKKRKEKGLKPSELYKRANVDRRHYSRLMGPEGRRPSMNTVVSFALALRLDCGEFDAFLQTAGFALSSSSSRDVCIMFCLENSIYDIDDVNALLFAVGIEPLSRE